MEIQIDTREKARAIKNIIKCFDNAGVNHYSSKLYVGDYMSLDNPRVIIDRKQNLYEVCNNVCQQHDRFIVELKKADAAKIKLIFLVEHGQGIKTLDDVLKWENRRLKTSPLAVSGERLHKILFTLQKNFNIEFLFCTKQQTGSRIIELLKL